MGRGFAFCPWWAWRMTMALELQLIDTSADDCNNAGPACFGCPNYDYCENHCDFED